MLSWLLGVPLLPPPAAQRARPHMRAIEAPQVFVDLTNLNVRCCQPPQRLVERAVAAQLLKWW